MLRDLVVFGLNATLIYSLIIIMIMIMIMILIMIMIIIMIIIIIILHRLMIVPNFVCTFQFFISLGSYVLRVK